LLKEIIMTTLLDKILAEYEDRMVDGWDLDDVQHGSGFLLVEENVLGGYWLTTHDSPEDASKYLDSQESLEDYRTKALINLATGEQFMPVVTTTWTTHPDGPVETGTEDDS
jgi:hypothetical protein